MNRFSVLLYFMVGLVVSLNGEAGTLAQFRISGLGDIEVELFEREKPITVQNFIRYVQSGRYQDSILHRCPVSRLSRVSDFVVQGGGIRVSNRGQANAVLDDIPRFPEIQNEFSMGRRFGNIYGTIAMAKRGGETNSASSQWFFNLGNNSFLDAADSNNLFVVFGRVVRGTNVLNQFIGRSYGNGVVNMGEPINELPVTFAGIRQPTYNELYYVDVTLLNVQVQALPAGGREISWNSVSNKVNVVEFTETLPPLWRALVNTNGSGETMSVRDTSNESAARFYRIRVEY